MARILETTSNLEDYGWNDHWRRTAEERLDADLIPARVVETHRGSWVVVARTEGGMAELKATAAGKLLHGTLRAAELPVTGDWVLIRTAPGSPDSGTATVHACLPRKSCFSRKAPGDAGHDKVEEQVIAANVDIALIVAAAGKDWNPRRIERYLTLAWESGARPALVITKTDLAEDPDALAAEGAGLAPGVPLFPLCARTGEGMDALRNFLAPGLCAVLLGSSGAGKSTLLNTLAGKDLQRVREVREDDQRGRHTTTGRTLFRLASGALVIDTPGLRELQLWTDGEGVDGAFSDIEDLAARCRFKDCRHQEEPGCAVREALESGALDEGRLGSWSKLRREVEYLERRGDKSAELAERAKWKQINKSMRSFQKATRGFR